MNVKKADVLIFWEKWFKNRLFNEKIREIDNFWEKRYYDKFEKFVQNKVEILSFKNNKVLEAGCGSGDDGIRLAKLGNNLVLLDGNSSALSYAKRIAKLDSTKLVFKKGSLFDLPFKSGQFDLVFNVGVIEEYNFNDAVKIIKEMKRVTKKGKYVIVGIPNPRNPEIYYSRWSGTWKSIENNYYEENLNKLMKEAELKQIQIDYIPTLFAFGYFNFLKPFVSLLPRMTDIVERVLIRYSVVIVGIGRVE